MSAANYAANIEGVNAQLGREITRAMAKAKMTVPAVVKATGLGESWVKQVKTGRIDKPKPEWLTTLAEELGADPAEWLALSNQLGAAVPARPLTPDQSALIAVLTRQAKATERQNELVAIQAKAYHALAFSIDNAARGVLEKVATFDQALTELVELAGKQALAIDEDGAPVGPAQRS